MFNEVRAAFDGPCHAFMHSRPISKLLNGEFTVAHYAQVMRQIFHQARENPQLQALATVQFRGPQREMVAPFLRHAVSEVGHDMLALNDYVACGGEAANFVPSEQPHPATQALTGFAYYQICQRNVLGYLGYLFFLEFLPTSQGQMLITKLSQVGVPANAFTFLTDHVTVDVGHNKAMEKYCAALIRTTNDFDAVLYSMRATGHLYSRLLEGAMEMAEMPTPWGVAHEETAKRPPLDSNN